MTHQLKNASATYGAFGTVIGIVAFLLLLAKLSMYAAELNPVLARSLYPRALPLGDELTAADRRVLADLVHAERRRDDQAIGVGFGDHAAAQAAEDAPSTPTPASRTAERGRRLEGRRPGRPVACSIFGPDSACNLRYVNILNYFLELPRRPG